MLPADSGSRCPGRSRVRAAEVVPGVYAVYTWGPKGG